MPYRVVKFRRRNEHKTDYNARLSMLTSGIPRAVIRKTNRYIIAELVKSKEAQDSVICLANSSELLKYGWPDSAKGSLKSLAAAYLTGYLLGVKMKKLKTEKAIADLGLARSTKGSRLYAAIKGIIDSGIEMPCSQEILPDNERISGKNMKNKIDIEKIKSGIK